MKKSTPARERLINAASQLFYQKGYNKTGINEIIEHANVAKASLYAHFKTKDDLLLAYLNRKEDTFFRDLKNFVEMRVLGRDQIICLFDYLLEIYREKDFRGSWSINTLAEISKDNEKLRKEISDFKERFRAYIKKLVKDNLYRDDAHSIANKVYILFEGATTESYLHDASWPIMEAKDLVKTII